MGPNVGVCDACSTELRMSLHSVSNRKWLPSYLGSLYPIVWSTIDLNLVVSRSGNGLTIFCCFRRRGILFSRSLCGVSSPSMFANLGDLLDGRGDEVALPF